MAATVRQAHAAGAFGADYVANLLRQQETRRPLRPRPRCRFSLLSSSSHLGFSLISVAGRYGGGVSRLLILQPLRLTERRWKAAFSLFGVKTVHPTAFQLVAGFLRFEGATRLRENPKCDDEPQ